MTRDRRAILGWYFFDWASQPFHTLLITFIFAPYLKELLGSGSAAQTVWGGAVALAGVLIALASPWLGAVADRAGGRMRFVAAFSLLYVLGSWGLWAADPAGYSLPLVLGAFVIGMIGVEFATLFTNSMLPDLAPPAETGRISGNGWAFGYLGGLLALGFVLVGLADTAGTGRTLAGLPPLFGLDPAAREGVRAVGPFTAIWYALFMIPFFAWVRLPPAPMALPLGAALRAAGPALAASLRRLPAERPLAAYLGASMLYRDALNGFYTFGGLYAAGVLGWSIPFIGLFGILTLITGALFAWLGGKADVRFGPRPVITLCVLLLVLAAAVVPGIGRDHLFGAALPAGSRLPDALFFAVGGLIGAAGGSLQAASRTLLVRLAPPARIGEAFGLYALAGKATAFLAPGLIALVTALTGSQPLGITPLIGLFLLALILLAFVPKEGVPAR